MYHNTWTAREAAALVASKQKSARELLSGYLENIEKFEEQVGAWAYFSQRAVLEQAEAVDELIAGGSGASFPLIGVPIGVKDIFDTFDMPTENGTAIQKGRQPERDATAVQMLREAGAVIMGKTVTAELAVYTPGKTTNPHDPARTPGGSSSGSAAAVAAGMVPLAIGTQTNGSVIRPASYCGVVGFKPTFGAISREGILEQAPTLDQVGLFSSSIGDAALLAGVLMSGREGDAPVPFQNERGNETRKEREIGTLGRPAVAFVRSPVWHEATTVVQKACLDFIRGIDPDFAEIDLPPLCERGVDCHRTIMLYEMARNYRRFFVNHAGQISARLLGMLSEGMLISFEAYDEARGLAAEITDAVDKSLAPFDAVLTPATPSEAPIGLDWTGNPVFCTIWSLCGVPALSLPVLQGDDQMPLGLQLVGARGTDIKLLASAEWIERFYTMQRKTTRAGS